LLESAQGQDNVLARQQAVEALAIVSFHVPCARLAIHRRACSTNRYGMDGTRVPARVALATSIYHALGKHGREKHEFRVFNWHREQLAGRRARKKEKNLTIRLNQFA
jgi:hypothetical protein